MGLRSGTCLAIFREPLRGPTAGQCDTGTLIHQPPSQVLGSRRGRKIDPEDTTDTVSSKTTGTMHTRDQQHRLKQAGASAAGGGTEHRPCPPGTKKLFQVIQARSGRQVFSSGVSPGPAASGQYKMYSEVFLYFSFLFCVFLVFIFVYLCALMYVSCAFSFCHSIFLFAYLFVF